MFARLILISTFGRGPFSKIFQIAMVLRPWANVYGKQRAESYEKGANFFGKGIAVSHGLWIGGVGSSRTGAGYGASRDYCVRAGGCSTMLIRCRVLVEPLNPPIN